MRSLTFILIAIIGLAAVTPAAHRSDTLTLRLGQEKRADAGRIKVQFRELVEDSRCPADVNCVWAGVARIKVRLTRGRKTADVELNTTDKKTAVFQGYSVTLTELEPRQSTTSKYSPSAYTATISISKAKK